MYVCGKQQEILNTQRILGGQLTSLTWVGLGLGLGLGFKVRVRVRVRVSDRVKTNLFYERGLCRSYMSDPDFDM